MANETTADKKALDLTEGMTTVEGFEADEELLLARDLTGTLIKSVKAFRFYPADNPTLKGFRDQLVKRFQFFLNKYQSFVIQIGEYDLSYKGKILYENRDVKASLAYLLYKDGMRELRFTKGLEEWEIQGLMDIIRGSDVVNQLEDDVVTLMWERDFTHISYLATDEFLEEAGVVIPENVEKFRKNLVFKPIAHHVEVDMIDEEYEDGVGLDEVLARRLKRRLPLCRTGASTFSHLTRWRDCEEKLKAEIDPAFVLNILDTLFEILALEKEPESYQDVVNVIA